MVASRELQCSQRVASVEAAAPQFGQLRVCAAIAGNLPRAQRFRKLGVAAERGSARRSMNHRQRLTRQKNQSFNRINDLA